MNKEQFEKELDMKLASLKEEMMQKFEEKDEFPKKGDTYYYLTARGKINDTTWDDYEFDKNLLAIGNFFETEEEAKFESERRKVIAELKKYAEPKDRKWDGNLEHLSFFYETDTKKIGIGKYCSIKMGNLYFKTEGKAREALKAVGEDRFKKYYLRVED